MDFRLLGPLEVVGDGGRAVPLGTGRRRSLLAYLLLRANEPVPSDRLVDALWGEEPPATAAQMVQNHVSALRRELGANGRLETHGSAYRLNVTLGERDVDRFDGLVARARTEPEAQDAAATLREALGLWRGSPLADLEYEAFAQAEIARLDELRWAAFEACMEAELALGRQAELVPELEGAVAAQPLRERLQGQLILALYRSGRQADALAAYRRARETLVEEIGVEPGSELRALQAAMLDQDPALNAPAALPRPLAGGSPVLAGRTAELALLRERLGHGGVIAISGPAGIGKTRLAAELARDALRKQLKVAYATTPDDALAAACQPRTLVIADNAGPALDLEGGDAALVLVLRDGPPGEIVLGPLDQDAVAEIAGLYMTPAAAASQAAALTADTGGVPLAVHRTAAEWARSEAAALVAASAQRAASERTDLRTAEADLAGDVIGLQAAEQRLAGEDAPPEAAVCPYLGLATFDSDQSGYFFGRERLVAELVARLVGAPLLAVVGPSGSGKSSVVRAGLLPALAGGVLPGSAGWKQVLMRPGAHPRETLDRLLVRGKRTVLAVDQFEELFTACRDETERAAFIDALVDAAAGDVVVVLALRADFYGRCAVYEGFAQLVGANHVLVGPMRRDELRRAIELPAQRAGLTVEPGLTAALIDDVVDAPGALPLLSAALLELWRDRDGRILRRATYERTGGVRGAIGRLAEQAYARLDETERETARRILGRLADAGEQATFVRRRVPLDEFGPDSSGVLDALADSRLVTVDDESAEVAHEALLREWPRLRAWLDEDAEGRRLHHHLIHAARDWDAGGHDRGELYRGARLASALDWVEGHDPDLNEREREFVSASRAAAEEEGERQRRSNRRLRVLITGIASVLVVAVAAGVVALHQRGQARGAAVVADAQRLGAEALVEGRLDRALLLARTGVALDDTTATRGSLLSVLLRSPAALGIAEHGSRLFTVAISPDQRVFAVGDEGGAVTFYDTATREQVGEYVVYNALIQDVRYSPDGRTLAIAALDQANGQRAYVDLIDPQTHVHRARVRLAPMRVPGQFELANTMFLGAGDDLMIVQWSSNAANGPPSALYRVDTATGAIEDRLRVGRHGSQRLSVTADGKTVFLTSAADDATWEIDTQPLRVARTYPFGGNIGAVSPDGRSYAIASQDGRVRLLDTGSGRLRPFGGRYGRHVNNMAFTPDGHTLVSSGDDGKVHAWDVERGTLTQTFAGHSAWTRGLAVSSDGRTVASASADGKAILWDLAGDRRLDRPFATRAPFAVETTPRGIAVSPDGRTLAFTDSDGSVDLVDTGTLRRRRTLRALTGFAAGVDFSPDGRRLAVCGEHGRVTLWDAQTLDPLGDLKGLLGGVCQGVAFSPDGKQVAASEVDIDHPRLRVWDVQRQTLTSYRSAGGAASIAYSPDGRLIAAAVNGNGTDIRDAKTGALVKRLLTTDFTRSLAWSPDGKLLVVGQYDGTAMVYSTADWRPSGRPLEVHSARITYVDFSPDGRTLLMAGADGTVALWDVAGQKPIGSPLAFTPGTFMAAAFSHSGRYVFAVPTSGQGIRFDLSADAWTRHACLVAGRELTRLEWADALPGHPYRRVCGS